jgi:DNA-binding transcriptional MocR family regulator
MAVVSSVFIAAPSCVIPPSRRTRAPTTVLRSRDLFLVEDAANHMLATRTPPPLATFAPERSFLVASVSKVLAPGLRVAFVTGPRAELAAITRRVWATQWMVGPIGAEMVAMWLEDGVVDRTVKKKREAAARRQALVRKVFGRRRVTAHPDALHAWIALPGPRHPRPPEIVVTPASAFWARSTPAPNAIRVALGGIDRLGALERALVVLAAGLR